MINYPDILVRKGVVPVYRALCAAGPDGFTHEQIAAHARYTGGMKGIRQRNTQAFVDIRSALKDHGLTVRSTASDRPGAAYFIAALDVVRSTPSPDSPFHIVAGIKTYSHIVGPDFDTAGARVTMPFVSSLHEVRP